MKKKAIIFVSIVLSCAILSFTPPAERYFEIAKNLDIFASLFKEVNALYVDEINPNKLVRTGIDAMLNSLDPYTNYISEDEIEDYNTMNTGQYGGIGALTREMGHRIVVTMVYEGYPAQKNGLKIGDEVVSMDNIELAKLSPEEANHLMRGQVGTPLKLAIRRLGEPGLTQMEFRREKIKVSNVPYSGMITPDIGYVQLSDFTHEAGREVKNAVVSLKEKGAKKIILDLRGNPGGLLFEAVNICNIFLPKGKTVVTTKGKTENSNMTYETLSPALDIEIQLAVLINRGSASASEIVAGTIQDYDRGLVIGEKSFGKGLVQLSRPLSYKSQVKITTAKYYTPTGRCIQVLDYSHRRADGSVGSIPDSLKKEFKTSRGRIVFDGGGIDPDIKVPGQEAAAISQVVHARGFLFDYATLYASKHLSIAPARAFSLTEAEYQEFITWMKGKEYTFHSKAEAALSGFAEEAKKERYYNELKPQLDLIQVRLDENRKSELNTFKDQIKMMLEEEIVTRYYLEKGAVEVGFKNDPDLKGAVEALNDQPQYKKILNLP